ncbi:hypothetical protein OUZ56_012283 [Daphnia magna]|uniref:Uncharacterized protein n=1 Tax=Daphnia magna TaxID=35525 RepID=A0ABQ9Z2J6_9CRUS|nr:hypothetical protein OUZ56_012283 [Daphnia magna]
MSSMMILEYYSPDIVVSCPPRTRPEVPGCSPCLMAPKPLSIDPAKYSLIGMGNATSLTDLSLLSRSCIALAIVEISASLVKVSTPRPPTLVSA